MDIYSFDFKLFHIAQHIQVARAGRPAWEGHFRTQRVARAGHSLSRDPGQPGLLPAAPVPPLPAAGASCDCVRASGACTGPLSAARAA